MSETFRIIANAGDDQRLYDEFTSGAENAWLHARALARDPDVDKIQILDREADAVVAEWNRLKGVVFPPALLGRQFRPERVVVSGELPPPAPVG